MNADASIAFLDEQEVNKQDNTKYLGNNVNKMVDLDKEINLKIKETYYTWFELHNVWVKSNTDRDKRWKLVIFDAVIRSKLLYGLETVFLTDARLKRLDAVQYRGLRQILKVPHTYIDRQYSNAKLLEMSNTLIEQFAKYKPNRIRPFSEYWRHKCGKLLGHVIRTDWLSA